MHDDALFIRDVAAAARVSTDTIRHYEQKGLLGPVPRDASGYRRYDDAALHRIRVIRRAVALGFTLDELARIFAERAAGTPPCRRVRRLAEAKAVVLSERIAELTALRDGLQQLIRGWDEALDRTPANGFAHLLDRLA